MKFTKSDSLRELSTFVKEDELLSDEMMMVVGGTSSELSVDLIIQGMDVDVEAPTIQDMDVIVSDKL